MRRVRFTYTGAYHHVISRGIDGKIIFPNDMYKFTFLKLLEEKSTKLKIRIFAFCLMNNHYHLVLENSSGKLSDFMKQLNSHYAQYFRHFEKSKGYLFQGRFKSLLIQDDSYLKTVIAYVMLNPVRADIVKNPYDYKWSSINFYFNKKTNLLDNTLVEEMFESRDIFKNYIYSMIGLDLPVISTRMGKMIGEMSFTKTAQNLFDRRKDETVSMRRRVKDYSFKSPDQVIEEFEDEFKLKISELNSYSKIGKKLRNELLIRLKDLSGLKYNEIIKFDLFRDLKLSSLPKLYRRTKKNNEY
ncbi:MAG: transposase [bacterium]